MSKQPTRLFDIPRYQLQHGALEDAYATKINGVWQKLSTANFIEMAETCSRGLMEMGVTKDDKIALISTNNRFEWHVMDMGILQLGAANVPVYPTISSADYKFIFSDAEVKYCFVSDRALYDKVMAIKEEVPSLEEVFIFEEEPGVRNWKEVLELGKANPQHQAELEKRMEAVQYEDLATLIYTSGTTGFPKGVMLAHKNLVSNVVDSCVRIPSIKNTKALSFLPICHVFERMLTYLYMYQSVSIYFGESIDKIGDNIREVKPELFAAVPRLLEKVYDKIVSKGSELSGLKKMLFFWAVEVAKDYEEHAGEGFYEFKRKIAAKLIFSKWQEALGGNIKAIVSGGAALNPSLNAIYTAAGFNIQEGYGLTETSPVISVNGPDDKTKIVGSVGMPIPNVEVKIEEDGEIMCKGPNVMMGYYKNPEQTAEAFTDGWFHTGDIGEWLNGNFLRITDRKKEMFKTSGGKYVAPQVLENKLKESRFIEQVMVIGSGEKHPAAFIQPDYEFVKSWARKKGIAHESIEDLAKNKLVKSRIAEDVELINETFGKSEQIKKFELTTDVWSVDAGHLTPKLSLKRKAILAKYPDLYKTIYSEE